MIILKPMILYYDNGQPERRRLLEKSVSHMGIICVSVTPALFKQTVGHLAKLKGFPAKPQSPLEVPPSITEEVMVMCNFSEKKLDELLTAMKQGLVPRIALKAVLTAQNSFWTFAQLFEELYEEHRNFYSKEESGDSQDALDDQE